MGLKNHIEMIVSGLIPYSRKRMIKDLNGYLFAYKLHQPSCLSSHEVRYYINKEQEVIGLKYHQIDYVKSSDGGYGMRVSYKYFGSGIDIMMRDNRGTTDTHRARKLALRIVIEDSVMKDIMTDEFKGKIKKIFGKDVYTSNDFRTYKSMDYEAKVYGSRRQVTRAFIKINKMIEKLATKNEVV